jgi:hypothetical protein
MRSADAFVRESDDFARMKASALLDGCATVGLSTHPGALASYALCVKTQLPITG